MIVLKNCIISKYFLICNHVYFLFPKLNDSFKNLIFVKASLENGVILDNKN